MFCCLVQIVADTSLQVVSQIVRSLFPMCAVFVQKNQILNPIQSLEAAKVLVRTHVSAFRAFASALVLATVVLSFGVLGACAYLEMWLRCCVLCAPSLFYASDMFLPFTSVGGTSFQLVESS